MYKALLFLFVVGVGLCYSQDASDYSARTLLEVRDKNNIYWDTTIEHKAGFNKCQQGLIGWIKDNDLQYRFIVTVFNKDSGIIQIALPVDCKLRSNSKFSKYYMVLISTSNIFKMSYDNVDLSTMHCMEVLRSSMKQSIIKMVKSLPDSIAYEISDINRGIGFDKISKVDSIFYALKADSIAREDSLKRGRVLRDSIARVDSLHALDLNVSLDTIILQRIADSIMSVVEEDSIDMYKRDHIIFKGQSILKGKLSLDTRIECLKFMLLNKLTTLNEATVYLMVLKKYCMDRQDLFYSMRHLVIGRDQSLCVLYYKKSKDEVAIVQTELYRVGNGDQ